MAGRFPHPKFRSFLADGTPNNGGKVYIYLNGTTTKVGAGAALDARAGSDVANPLILDSAGEGNLWLAPGAQYTIKIDTSADVELSSTDGISSNDLSTWVATGSDVYYSAGNVYIGASSGSETLDVTGTVAISSTLTVSGLSTFSGDALISGAASFSTTAAFTGVATFTAQSVHNGGLKVGDDDEIVFGDGNDANIEWVSASSTFSIYAPGGNIVATCTDFGVAGGPIIAAGCQAGYSSLQIPAGVTPTSPLEGWFWYDGTNLKFEDGVGTKTITWS